MKQKKVATHAQTPNVADPTLQHLKDRLNDQLQNYSAAQYVEELANLNHRYLFVISAIQSGFGNIDPPQNEDKAATLDELRENCTLTIQEIADLSHFVASLSAFIHSAAEMHKRFNP